MSDLKTLLTGLGYDDSQIDAIANKKKIYFQNDVDNIVFKKENSLKEKFEKNYILKADYDLLQSEHNNLVKDIKTKNIKDQFVKNGGNENYFEDYMKINSNLMDLEEKQINEHIVNTQKTNSWAFNNKQNTNIPYNYQDTQNIDKSNQFDGQTIYGRKWDI